MDIIPPPPPPDDPWPDFISGGRVPRRPKAPPPQPTLSIGGGSKPKPEASYGTIGFDDLLTTMFRGLFTTQDWRATAAIWMGVSLGCFIAQVIS